MAGEWVTKKMGELGRVVTGKTPSTTDPANFNGPFPFITIPDLDGRVVIYCSERSLSQKGADLMKFCLLPPGAVMMSCIATVGRCGITARPSFTNQQINSVIPTEADSRFLYYIFTQLGHALESAGGGGSVYTNVSKSRFSDIEVSLPDEVGEQRAIAHILGTLDDKIELNQRMNETLEAMARTLFKSWFVDFDPVRAKAEGRDPGLPKPLADLFPDSFEDSDLGEIPKGWAVEPLSEIATLITKGTTPTQSDIGTDDEANDGINYVRVNAIDEAGAVLFDKLTSIPESVHLGVLKRSVLQAGDVLYTIAGTIGRTAIVDESLLPANTNQAVAIIRPKRPIPSSFLVMTMRAAAFREELHSNIVHAVQANLSLGMLSRARTVVPPEEKLLQMYMPIAEIAKRVSATRAESRSLATLRDALLPKLLSGEIKVCGA